jgi:hypothetical protein
VLIYPVDSGIDGGDSPVAVRPREGQGPDDAPHRVGDVADIEDDNGARLRVTVLGRTGPAWDVEIQFHARAAGLAASSTPSALRP